MSFVVDREVTIQASAATVWEVITDFARYGDWNPFVLQCKSSLQPGEAIDMKVALMSRPQQQREYIKSCDAGRGFVYCMKPFPVGALSSLRSHDIQPDGDTSCTYRSHFQLEGWMMPVVRGLLGKRLEAGFEGMTEAIRDRAEQLWQARRQTA